MADMVIKCVILSTYWIFYELHTWLFTDHSGVRVPVMASFLQ